MPMPKPKKDESHDDFMSRCMSNSMMQEEYPDKEQCAAVCEAQWGKKSASNGREIRSFTFTIGGEKEERKMVGHAAVFNQPTDIGGWFREQVMPGAFKKSIKDDDIRALFNHNPDHVLGRSTAGTLKLSEDETGLKVTIDPPDTQFARDLGISIERGDINQMSFAFEVLEEEWVRGGKNETDLRTLKKVRLYDVSPVTFPAYEGTDIAVRSHEAWKKQDNHIPQETESNLSLHYQLLLRRI